MFKGDIHSEYTNIDQFIIDNEHNIKSLINQGKTHLAPDDYEDMDDYRLALCTLASTAIMSDSLDVESIKAVQDDEKELLYQLVQTLFVRVIIWSLESKGLIEAIDDDNFRIVGADSTEPEQTPTG